MVLDFTNATFIEKVYPFLIYARATEPPTIHPTAAPIAPPTTELPTAVPITEPIIVQTAEVPFLLLLSQNSPAAFPTAHNICLS